MKTLIVIPARGGSKRIPRKNVRIMCGKPLIVYSIENAKSLRQDALRRAYFALSAANV